MNFAAFNVPVKNEAPAPMTTQQTTPFNNVDTNIPSNFEQDTKIEGVKKEGHDDRDKKKRGMSRLRMRRTGRGGKLTKNGLDMQSFYKTKICPYLLAVRFYNFFYNFSLFFSKIYPFYTSA